MIKRIFDIVLAAIGLIVLCPLLVAIAVTVRLGSRGPVLYRGVRIGRYGKPFRIFKFRTMVPDAEKLGGSCTADDDVRITRMGRLLRKLKLDELPQLFNVVAGTMSLVGPRPEVEEFVNLFTEEERQILTVSPGITDWASLWDSDEGLLLAGSLDADQTYLEKIRPEKLRLQLEYVRRRTLWIDLKILLATLGLILTRLFRREHQSSGFLKWITRHDNSKPLIRS